MVAHVELCVKAHESIDRIDRLASRHRGHRGHRGHWATMGLFSFEIQPEASSIKNGGWSSYFIESMINICTYV